MSAAVTGLRDEIAAALRAHHIEWVDEAGFACGCDVDGVLSLPTMSEADRHQVDALLPIIERHIAAEVATARAETLAPFARLFSGAPDSPCRTTSRETALPSEFGPFVAECVEVPMRDLNDAFTAARQVTP